MKSCLPLLLILITTITYSPVYSQKSFSKPVYVIVHGAWGGSWAFRKIDLLLTENRCIVYRPSLTGQGERVHLATPNIGLSTYIKDVENL